MATGRLLRRCVVLAAGIVLAGAVPVNAARVSDPDDMASRLDIRMFRVQDERRGVGRITIKTYGEWDSRYLSSRKDTAVAVQFDD
ncbi:MAG: hypothetical protein QOH90_59, partial [Actinomycetota bacterium]|nr:hypothetical protein [Actinomycetota bacterium]